MMEIVHSGVRGVRSSLNEGLRKLDLAKGEVKISSRRELKLKEVDFTYVLSSEGFIRSI